MKKKYAFCFTFVAVIVCCSNAGQKSGNEVLPTEEKKYVEEKEGEIGAIKELALFSECKNYDNKLSSIAQDVKFIPLCAEPPIRDFFIHDIQVNEDNIYLLSSNFIIQYDGMGKYIRNIGRAGMGPDEYIDLYPPLQLDCSKKLIYALDTKRRRLLVYRFDGSFKKSIPMNFKQGCIAIMDSTQIIVRQRYFNRYLSDCAAVTFIDHHGKLLKNYPSHLYPIPKENMESFGPDASFLWNSMGVFYSLEYGCDTIFRINQDALIPAMILTGELKLNKNELFRKKNGSKLRISFPLFRPNAGIFESKNFIIFHLNNDYEHFYQICNKATMQFHRTFYKDPVVTRTGIKKMDCFIDDIVSGLEFAPQYQSQGYAISLVPATAIVEKKQDILRFITSHPTSESERLKNIVHTIDEMDNSIIMMVKFK